MKVFNHIAWSISASLLIAGCATPSVRYKTSDTSHSKGKRHQVAQDLSIPSLSDNYGLGSDDDGLDQDVQHRGKKARGTNDY